LIAGHAILTGLGVLSYTRRVPGPWNRSATAYALDLTLTTPLLPLLCGIALLAALEARVVGGKAGITGPRVLRLALWAAAATILVMVDWTPTHLVAAALGVMVLAAGRFARWLQPAALALAALAAAVATARGARYRGADTPVERADAELYSWARDTPKQTSFIVPPLARGFRYHTRKAVYVDYDLLPPASPQAVRSWRDRLELVCRPDRRIATVPAWRRPYAMERAYARANTPARAAELLQQLGGDYLVWDARGLEIPPHVPVDRPDDSRVVTAFRNERYIVYALAEGRSRGTP
jgi:hypothetical protein